MTDIMHYDSRQLDRLIAELEAVRLSAYWMEREFAADVEAVADRNRESARNLLHYVALRRRDLRDLQEELAGWGLSSLGRSESHVLGNVDPVLSLLHRLRGTTFAPGPDEPAPVSIRSGANRLANNSAALFGEEAATDGRENVSVPIMVTMPTAASIDFPLIRDLVAIGMTCMRINCAHEGPPEWAAMKEHLDRARRELGRDCRLFMDVAGPKIRTGEIEPGPRVIRWEPRRDVMGNPIAPAALWLTPFDAPEPALLDATRATVPFDPGLLAKLEPGDTLEFLDLRGRRRSLEIVSREGTSLLAESDQLTYLGAESRLTIRPHDTGAGRDLPDSYYPSAILPRQQAISLSAGDTLRLVREPIVAQPVFRDNHGQLSGEPIISCTCPDVFGHVAPGERVLFDDGKIGGRVVRATEDELVIEITHPTVEAKSLRSDKGINFPDTEFGFPALTEKDLVDLDFIAAHADMVGFSFVSRASDVEALQRELARRTSRDLGIVLKIETKRGFDRLPQLLLTALRSPHVGVMIARGDLAVECGFERLAEVQEEILWICEAAHVPVVWATQVLEKLSKKGIPTRAEITDAAMGERAECIMLNKGPHIVESVRMLVDIVGRMRAHQHKKSPRLRALGVSSMENRIRRDSSG